MWNPSAFQGCFIGIPRTVSYNPYNPLYNPTTQGFFSLLTWSLVCWFCVLLYSTTLKKTKTVQSNLRVGTTVHSWMCIFFHLLLASVSICLVIKQLQQTILNTYHQMISHVIIYVIINIVESIPFTQSMSMKFTQDVEPWEVKGSLLATRCSHHQPPRPMTREASSNHWPLTINVKRPMNERLRRIRMTLYIINIYKYR